MQERRASSPAGPPVGGEAAAYIGLGGNLGDREAALHEALRRLAGLGTVEAVSSFYETEPWGYTEQPLFLNAVCCFRTRHPSAVLLAQLKAIETAMGRQPTFRYGPRLIDLDLLLYDDLVVDTPDLTLPHPYLHERPFVLVPLAEIAPDLRHPVLKRTIAELAREVGRAGVRALRARGKEKPSPG